MVISPPIARFRLEHKILGRNFVASLSNGSHSSLKQVEDYFSKGNQFSVNCVELIKLMDNFLIGFFNLEFSFDIHYYSYMAIIVEFFTETKLK